jgi:hypothetical protein
MQRGRNKTDTHVLLHAAWLLQHSPNVRTRAHAVQGAVENNNTAVGGSTQTATHEHSQRDRIFQQLVKSEKPAFGFASIELSVYCMTLCVAQAQPTGLYGRQSPALAGPL